MLRRFELRRIEGASIPRVVLLMAGVLAIEIAFIVSYATALTRPYPHGLRVGVVGPAAFQKVAAARLTDSHGALVPQFERSKKEALDQLKDGVIGGFLELEGSSLTAYCSGKPSPAICQTIEIALNSARIPISYRIKEINQLPREDPEGLAPFYLTIGWVLGGYFVASLVALARGSEPRPRMAMLRLLGFLGFSVCSGFLGAYAASFALPKTANLISLSLFGILVVFSVACFAAALEAIFGQLGIGLAVLIFVVLGNPSSGGPYPPSYLPEFWRILSNATPNAASLAGVRAISYFSYADLVRFVLILFCWAVAGVALFLTFSSVFSRRRPRLDIS